MKAYVACQAGVDIEMLRGGFLHMGRIAVDVGGKPEQLAAVVDLIVAVIKRGRFVLAANGAEAVVIGIGVGVNVRSDGHFVHILIGRICIRGDDMDAEPLANIAVRGGVGGRGGSRDLGVVDVPLVRHITCISRDRNGHRLPRMRPIGGQSAGNEGLVHGDGLYGGGEILKVIHIGQFDLRSEFSAAGG